MNRQRAFFTGKVYRIFSAAFGLLLVCIGLYALVFSDVTSVWRYVVGVALVLLGGNSIYSAFHAAESWISKIGPTP